MRRISSSVIGLLAALLVGVVLVACAGAASPAATSGPAGRPVAGNPDELAGDGGGAAQIPDPQAGAPLVVYAGSLVLEVADLRPAIDQATALVAGLGGHLAASHEQNAAGRQDATVTFRIPAQNWTSALIGLRAIGQKVLSEDTDAEDVTAQVVDLDARIANLRASETALQGIMGRATTIADVLKVQEELTSVRGDIESMTAQRDNLADQAALGTLEVGFSVPFAAASVASGGWDLGREIDNAVAALVRLGQGFASLAVWLVIVILPVLIPVGVILYIAVRIRRRMAARAAMQPPIAPSM